MRGRSFGRSWNLEIGQGVGMLETTSLGAVVQIAAL